MGEENIIRQLTGGTQLKESSPTVPIAIVLEC